MSTPGRAPFYVYRIFDGVQTLYVGKGSGRRLAAQKRKFRCSGEIIEECKSDDHAFEREKHWIAELRPTENMLPGGNGGRVRPKPLSAAAKRAIREFQKFEAELSEVGPRRYVARFLTRKLAEFNCEAFGVSKLDLNRLRAVANGPRC